MSIEALIQDSLKPRVRDLQGQSALVTGASSGIGLATAVRLAQLGCNLHLVARREERLKQIKDELFRLNKDISIKYYALDLTHKEALTHLESNGATDVDILINNAGLAKGLSTISNSLNSDWSQMIDTNITSAFEVTRHTVRHMIQKKNGDIVVLSSVAAHSAYENGAVYCATKHAVKAFHEALRLETLELNIRVIMISPGMVDTEFSTVRFSGDHARAQSVYQGVQALNAGDVAESILFALRQPRHINLDDIIIKPQQQGNPWKVHRRG